MNNLDKILDRIADDNDREIDKINLDKQAQLNAIAKETKDKISDINKHAEGIAMKEYQSVIARAESAGVMTEREIILKAKSELIEKIYRDAEKFLCSLPDEKYITIMARLLSEAVIERMDTVRSMTEIFDDESFSGESKVPFEVILSTKDRDKFGRDIISKAEQNIANKDITVPKIRLSKNSADINGGFIVRYGDAETNCSIAAMIANIKDKTYAKVASVLFPQ